MKPVLIVGAGISGLSTAYWLTQKGIPCRIVDEASRTGGLLHSQRTEFGLIEWAANGFMAHSDVLEMCHDLKIPLAERHTDRSKKFIFRGKPRRWPLTFKESISFGLLLAKHTLTFCRSLRPKKNESVKEWGLRCFNSSVLDWLIAPALQGVYAGRIDRMSASLVLGRFFARGSHRHSNRGSKKKKLKLKGTLAPEQGMGQLVERLTEWLKSENVVIQLEHKVGPLWSKDFSALVVAIPAWELSSIQVDGVSLAPDFQIETLPLVSATLFFERHSSDLKGFGCLFPKIQGFYSLGVLFNDSIFINRSDERSGKRSGKRSETWILGGATNKEIVSFGDPEILRQIQTDRKRLLSLENEEAPIHFQVKRWEKALPHMTKELEQQLEGISLPSNVYLSGNYLGRIGLSQIISRNKILAEEIVDNMEKKIV